MPKRVSLVLIAVAAVSGALAAVRACVGPFHFLVPINSPLNLQSIFGLSATLAHRVQAFVYDEVLFGYSDYHSNTVSLGLRAQF